MADTHETITDIIKKIRAEADFIEETARGSFKAGEVMDGMPFTESDLESALDLAETKRKEADRLEAALKRELSKNASKNGADFGQLGDAAKLREAVEFIKQYFDKIDPFNINTYTFSQIEVEHINEAIDAALAAPPRNCDVGTPEEQAKRLDAFCDSHGHGFDGQKCYSCENCPFISIDRCELAWAQLPYEEGGAK